jgi:hypothetical protein
LDESDGMCEIPVFRSGRPVTLTFTLIFETGL